MSKTSIENKISEHIRAATAAILKDCTDHLFSIKGRITARKPSKSATYTIFLETSGLSADEKADALAALKNYIIYGSFRDLKVAEDVNLHVTAKKPLDTMELSYKLSMEKLAEKIQADGITSNSKSR